MGSNRYQHGQAGWCTLDFLSEKRTQRRSAHVALRCRLGDALSRGLGRRLADRNRRNMGSDAFSASAEVKSSSSRRTKMADARKGDAEKDYVCLSQLQ